MKNAVQLVRPHSEGLRNGAPTLATRQRDGKGVENRPMHRSKAAALSGRVLMQGDIFDPMQAIFNLPVLARSLEQLGGSPSGRDIVKCGVREN
ncbi:hypothetical protein IQ250_00125 [Pseudanabaenaceae cyanobacterium LEGE 13415]|nr:hypothetical protein [Pseudanabaenaceae cyanobacterium LEGE 13415]